TYTRIAGGSNSPAIGRSSSNVVTHERVVNVNNGNTIQTRTSTGRQAVNPTSVNRSTQSTIRAAGINTQTRTVSATREGYKSNPAISARNTSTSSSSTVVSPQSTTHTSSTVSRSSNQTTTYKSSSTVRTGTGSPTVHSTPSNTRSYSSPSIQSTSRSSSSGRSSSSYTAPSSSSSRSSYS